LCAHRMTLRSLICHVKKDKLTHHLHETLLAHKRDVLLELPDNGSALTTWQIAQPLDMRTFACHLS
jgi:hypothetical protein